MQVVEYRDRVTGALLRERVYAAEQLEYLYGTRTGNLLLQLMLSRRTFSWLYGFTKRSRRSRAQIRQFIETLGVETNELEKPIDAYESLDEFFSRRLMPGARPVDRNPDHVLSPCDGRALAWQSLDGRELIVKNTRTTIEALLADAALAREFADPAVLLVRLAAADYHRCHFPADGAASLPRAVGNRLHSVHPIALEAGAPSFVNYRMVTRLDTEGFGPLLIVEVGALTVGSIVQTFTPSRVTRGQEKSYFRFGGSALMMLALAHRVQFDDDLISATGTGLESRVRVGTRVAVRRR
ncbi:MAG: phosphatidylserine decarboxylase [Vicinamibacterales bacterium]